VSLSTEDSSRRRLIRQAAFKEKSIGVKNTKNSSHKKTRQDELLRVCSVKADIIMSRDKK